ncbi:MAG: hypothetical protein SGPRY_013520, partial [Prymnesium sp.]
LARLLLEGSEGALFQPAVEASTPSWAPHEPAGPCASELRLQFAYALGSGRRNVVLLGSGEVAFYSGKLLVLHSPRSHQQRFLRAHTTEVRCIAPHPHRAMLASGQAGSEEGREAGVEICVWEADSSDPIARLSGCHAGGVACLGFSPDGRLLASVGSDGEHLVALWDWRAGRCVSHARSGEACVFELAWSPEGLAFATAGVGGLSIWRADGHSLAQSSPAMPSPSSPPCFTCVAYLPRELLVAGSESGEIFCWTVEGSLLGRYNSHDGAIFALAVDTTEGYLISGGSDGKLRVWGPELWPRRRRRSGGLRDEGASSLRLMDLTRLQETTPKPNRNRNPNPNPNRLQATLEADVCIRAIDWLGSKLVVSTLAGEALLGKMACPNLTPNHKAHHYLYPNERFLVASRHLASAVAALAFSPCSDELCAAAGEGAVLLSLPSLEPRASVHTEGGAVSALAYSPDGRVLAVGSEGGGVELHSTRSLARLGVCRGHTSPVVSIDWSEGGERLQSNCGFELRFWESQSCCELPPEQTREEMWASASCRIAWGLKGAVSSFKHPHQLTASARSAGGSLLACGGLDGGVSLFPFPCSSEQALSRTYDAHSAPLASLCWASADGALLSFAVGGGGGELMQWRLVGEERADPHSREAAEAAVWEEGEVDSDIEAELAPPSKPQSCELCLPLDTPPRPSGWERVVGSGEAPVDSLLLEWAYGPRVHDARGHCHWSARGEVVFPTASVAVIFEPRGAQRFFTGHSSEVILEVRVQVRVRVRVRVWVRIRLRASSLGNLPSLGLGVDLDSVRLHGPLFRDSGYRLCWGGIRGATTQKLEER